MHTISIPINDLITDSEQVRGDLSDESLRGLRKSIQDVGILHPLIVTRSEHGYRLVAGERRLHAALSLGYDEVPAVVLRQGLSVKQVQLVENLQREDLNPVERARAVKAYMDEEHLNKVQASRLLGVPRMTLTDWLRVLDLPERFQTAVVDNFHGGESSLGLSHIAEASSLASRLNSPGMQWVLLDAVLQYGLSKEETRRICVLVKENRDVSVEEAIAVVRRQLQSERRSSRSDEEKKPIDEKNLERLFKTVERSNEIIAQMRHMSGRFITNQEVTGLVSRLRRLRDLVDSALQELDEGDEERIRLRRHTTSTQKHDRSSKKTKQRSA